MIAVLIGTFAGTVIALLVWEVWRESSKPRKKAGVATKPPGWVADTIKRFEETKK